MDTNKNKIKKIIELIEDPIIKNKLKELYNKKYGNLENQIKDIEKYISKLTKQKENLEKRLKKGDKDDKN